MHVCAHTVGAWCPEEGSESPGIGVKGNLPPLGCWELKSSVRTASDLITTEPSLYLVFIRVYQFLKKQNKKKNDLSFY